MNNQMKNWLTPEEASAYCGFNIRTLRDWIKNHGLRYSQIVRGGGIRIKREWLDQFMEEHEVKNDPGDTVDRIVREMIQNI